MVSTIREREKRAANDAGTVVVRDEPVLVGGRRVVFLVLTMLLAAAVVTFARYWFSLPDARVFPVLYGLATVGVFYLIGPYTANTKFGNLNAWLAEPVSAEYDLLAAFDPDHVPERHYLTRTLGYFSDPQVGYVQPAQFYYNQDASFVARGAAEESYDFY